MTITVKKQIEETVQVEVPSAYYNYYCNRYYILKENGEIISFNNNCIIKWDNESPEYRDGSIVEALKSQRVDYDETVEKLETVLESLSQKVAY